MNRIRLSLDELKVESMATGAGAAVLRGTTTLTDPGDTAPPICDSKMTCVC
jgi:hypothetical protein